ncbi:hypothetical protein ACFL56_03185 [Candidatus Margulisiibacteriota bacterium]
MFSYEEVAGSHSDFLIALRSLIEVYKELQSAIEDARNYLENNEDELDPESRTTLTDDIAEAEGVLDQYRNRIVLELSDFYTNAISPEPQEDSPSAPSSLSVGNMNDYIDNVYDAINVNNPQEALNNLRDINIFNYCELNNVSVDENPNTNDVWFDERIEAIENFNTQATNAENAIGEINDMHLTLYRAYLQNNLDEHALAISSTDDIIQKINTGLTALLEILFLADEEYFHLSGNFYNSRIAELRNDLNEAIRSLVNIIYMIGKKNISEINPAPEEGLPTVPIIDLLEQIQDYYIGNHNDNPNAPQYHHAENSPITGYNILTVNHNNYRNLWYRLLPDIQIDEGDSHLYEEIFGSDPQEIYNYYFRLYFYNPIFNSDVYWEECYSTTIEDVIDRIAPITIPPDVDPRLTLREHLNSAIRHWNNGEFSLAFENEERKGFKYVIQLLKNFTPNEINFSGQSGIVQIGNSASYYTHIDYNDVLTILAIYQFKYLAYMRGRGTARLDLIKDTQILAYPPDVQFGNRYDPSLDTPHSELIEGTNEERPLDWFYYFTDANSINVDENLRNEVTRHRIAMINCILDTTNRLSDAEFANLTDLYANFLINHFIGFENGLDLNNIEYFYGSNINVEDYDNRTTSINNSSYHRNIFTGYELVENLENIEGIHYDRLETELEVYTYYNHVQVMGIEFIRRYNEILAIGLSSAVQKTAIIDMLNILFEKYSVIEGSLEIPIPPFEFFLGPVGENGERSGGVLGNPLQYPEELRGVIAHTRTLLDQMFELLREVGVDPNPPEEDWKLHKLIERFYILFEEGDALLGHPDGYHELDALEKYDKADEILDIILNLQIMRDTTSPQHDRYREDLRDSEDALNNRRATAHSILDGLDDLYNDPRNPEYRLRETQDDVEEYVDDNGTLNDVRDYIEYEKRRGRRELNDITFDPLNPHNFDDIEGIEYDSSRRNILQTPAEITDDTNMWHQVIANIEKYLDRDPTEIILRYYNHLIYDPDTILNEVDKDRSGSVLNTLPANIVDQDRTDLEENFVNITPVGNVYTSGREALESHLVPQLNDRTTISSNTPLWRYETPVPSGNDNIATIESVQNEWIVWINDLVNASLQEEEDILHITIDNTNNQPRLAVTDRTTPKSLLVILNDILQLEIGERLNDRIRHYIRILQKIIDIKDKIDEILEAIKEAERSVEQGEYTDAVNYYLNIVIPLFDQYNDLIAECEVVHPQEQEDDPDIIIDPIDHPDEYPENDNQYRNNNDNEDEILDGLCEDWTLDLDGFKDEVNHRIQQLIHGSNREITPDRIAPAVDSMNVSTDTPADDFIDNFLNTLENSEYQYREEEYPDTDGTLFESEFPDPMHDTSSLPNDLTPQERQELIDDVLKPQIDDLEDDIQQIDYLLSTRGLMPDEIERLEDIRRDMEGEKLILEGIIAILNGDDGYSNAEITDILNLIPEIDEYLIDHPDSPYIEELRKIAEILRNDPIIKMYLYLELAERLIRRGNRQFALEDIYPEEYLALTRTQIEERLNVRDGMVNQDEFMIAIELDPLDPDDAHTADVLWHYLIEQKILWEVRPGRAFIRIRNIPSNEDALLDPVQASTYSDPAYAKIVTLRTEILDELHKALGETSIELYQAALIKLQEVSAILEQEEQTNTARTAELQDIRDRLENSFGYEAADNNIASDRVDICLDIIEVDKEIVRLRNLINEVHNPQSEQDTVIHKQASSSQVQTPPDYSDFNRIGDEIINIVEDYNEICDHIEEARTNYRDFAGSYFTIEPIRGRVNRMVGDGIIHEMNENIHTHLDHVGENYLYDPTSGLSMTEWGCEDNDYLIMEELDVLYPVTSHTSYTYSGYLQFVRNEQDPATQRITQYTTRFDLNLDEAFITEERVDIVEEIVINASNGIDCDNTQGEREGYIYTTLQLVNQHQANTDFTGHQVIYPDRLQMLYTHLNIEPYVRLSIERRSNVLPWRIKIINNISSNNYSLSQYMDDPTFTFAEGEYIQLAERALITDTVNHDQQNRDFTGARDALVGDSGEAQDFFFAYYIEGQCAEVQGGSNNMITTYINSSHLLTNNQSGIDDMEILRGKFTCSTAILNGDDAVFQSSYSTLVEKLANLWKHYQYDIDVIVNYEKQDILYALFLLARSYHNASPCPQNDGDTASSEPARKAVFFRRLLRDVVGKVEELNSGLTHDMDGNIISGLPAVIYGSDVNSLFTSGCACSDDDENIDLEIDLLAIQQLTLTTYDRFFDGNGGIDEDILGSTIMNTTEPELREPRNHNQEIPFRVSIEGGSNGFGLVVSLDLGQALELPFSDSFSLSFFNNAEANLLINSNGTSGRFRLDPVALEIGDKVENTVLADIHPLNIMGSSGSDNQIEIWDNSILSPSHSGFFYNPNFNININQSIVPDNYPNTDRQPLFINGLINVGGTFGFENSNLYYAEGRISAQAQIGSMFDVFGNIGFYSNTAAAELSPLVTGGFGFTFPSYQVLSHRLSFEIGMPQENIVGWGMRFDLLNGQRPDTNIDHWNLFLEYQRTGDSFSNLTNREFNVGLNIRFNTNIPTDLD